MKKTFTAILAALLVLCMMVPALAEVKLGQVQYAAHGTKCFAVLTVALDGDTIVAAHIDEYQVMGTDTAVGVPNSDSDFGTNFPEGMALVSKRVNTEVYSANMTKAGSTVSILDNFIAIENFVVGKTVAELEAAIEGKDAAAMVDAVAGCTLVDTLGYVSGLLEAAKSVK